MTNEAYGNGFLVTFASALISSDLDDFSIYVGYGSNDPIDRIWETVIELCNRFGFPVERCHRIEVDLDIFKQYEAFRNGAYHNYGRLYLAEVLEEPTLLYLDSDVLIMDDLSKLVKLAPKNAALAAVQDRVIMFHSNDPYILDEKPDVDDTSPYFNNGLLLINNAKYREINILHQFKKLTPRLSNLGYHEQTLLNIIFKDKWKSLAFDWNSLTQPHCPTPLVIKNDPVRIIHFVGSKPWIDPAITIPNLFWYSLAQNIGVQIDRTVHEEYCELAQSFELSEHIETCRKLIIQTVDETPTIEQHRTMLLQNLNNFGAELSTIRNWLKDHNLNPVAEPFTNLFRLAK